jgi:hypothetical protein
MVDDAPAVMTPARWAREAAVVRAIDYAGAPAFTVAVGWCDGRVYEVSIVAPRTSHAERARAFVTRRQRKARQLARALVR